MIDSLYIGATGMHAQQQHVDAIANNLANVNTTGFKKSRVTFEDAFYRVTQASLADPVAGVQPLVLGLGTLVSSTSKSFTPGEIKQTDGPLDLAIRGNGFFEVTQPDGSSAYTRHGVFRVNNDGLLATPSGYAIKPAIQVPPEALEVVIAADGTVSARMPGEASPTELGQIELAMFTNPSGLDPIGENLYLASEASGQATLVRAGEEGSGALAQGYLESSNVKLAEEMVNLVLAQRAYELNARVIQVSDEMLSISNNLRR